MELKIGDEYYYCNAKPKYNNGVKTYEVYYIKTTITNIEVIEGDFRNVWYRDETGYQSSNYECDFLDRYGRTKKEAREKAIKAESELLKHLVNRLTTLINGEEKDD